MAHYYNIEKTKQNYLKLLNVADCDMRYGDLNDIMKYYRLNYSDGCADAIFFAYKLGAVRAAGSITKKAKTGRA